MRDQISVMIVIELSQAKAILPAVIVASNEVGGMRYARIIQRRLAKKRSVVSWGAADVDLPGEFPNRLVLKRLFVPGMRKGHCQIIEGETPAAAGRNLTHRLRKDRVIPS